MAMILEWFKARQATALGASLADSLLRNDASALENPAPQRSAEIQRLLQRAVRDCRPLKLNLFKRAKLLGSFKWRLLEEGVAQSRVDELTHLLLLQLSGARGLDGAATGDPRGRAPRKRLEPLLAEVEARFARGEYEAAVDQLQEVLAIDPNHSLSHLNLGNALYRLGRYPAAESEFRRAIQLNPNLTDAHFNLGTLLRWRGEFAAAETALRRAMKLNPRNPEPLVGLGHALGGMDRFEEAKSCFDKALRLQPRSASALCGLGWAASMEGRFTEAEKHLRGAMAADPNCSEAWALLVDLRRMTPADNDWVAGAERLLNAGLPAIEEVRVRFAMGKYFNDVGEYSRAFEQYKRANAMRKLNAVSYDRQGRSRFIDDMIRVYPREQVAQRVRTASGSEQPVFVTGMMRSGTTLAEQIIASHPHAAGAGELPFWTTMLYKHQDALRRAPPDAALTEKLAAAYLKVLARHGAGAARVVDKAPINAEYLGFIYATFPRSRVIYMRRDPIDTCLSCYFQDFANAQAFTMDLEDLAHYYREHHRLMTHLRAVLPKEFLLEVPYAELVADQEGWSRRIIEFIGLPWDPKVLQFEKTDRAVLTASSWQIRQKIYSSSVGRWKNYQKFIGPLLKLRDLSP